ncbi:hypothetical protein AAY473_024871 [Plecturocebus cupreus]
MPIPSLQPGNPVPLSGRASEDMESGSVARLEFSGVILAHRNLRLLCAIKTRFHSISQDGVNHLTPRSTHLGLPKCWDYRCESMPPAPKFIILQGFAYTVRLHSFKCIPQCKFFLTPNSDSGGLSLQMVDSGPRIKHGTQWSPAFTTQGGISFMEDNFSVGWECCPKEAEERPSRFQLPERPQRMYHHIRYIPSHKILGLDEKQTPYKQRSGSTMAAHTPMRSLTLSPRLVCRGAISAHCNFCLQVSNWEIPGEGATRIASATLLAGAALLGAECTELGAQRLRWSHPHKENSNWKR